MPTHYYEKIVDIIKDYLGPAAGRFVSRQVHSHLHKLPEDLEQKDIAMLAIRIRSGLVVLTHDEDAVNEAFQRISALTQVYAHTE